MASFPPPGSLTLCELNRDLITVDALSDDRANQTYGKLLGLVFSPVPFQPPPPPLENDTPEQEGTTATTAIAGETVPRKGPVALLQGIVNDCLKRLFYPNDVHLLPEVNLQGVSWHLNKHIIAFISGPNQVLVHDYEDPASASYESSSFTVWDVAQGVATPIRRGLGGISMLKWSPTGDYFFASKFDGTFYLWETNTWTSEEWSSSSGFVKCATWDPDGRMILLAFSKSSTLGSVHFASKPPSLDAHLLPVDLPEILSLTGSSWDWDKRLVLYLPFPVSYGYHVFGERLAVSFKGGDDVYGGLIAIYDTRRAPLISTSLIVGAVDFVARIHCYSDLISFYNEDICKILLSGHNLERANFD
ncbi:hypothetical protein TSUD_329140, partial [Trifolium subterraneum]